MKAYFGRKMPDIEALKDATERAKLGGFPASAYTVTREVALEDAEFKKLAEDLLEDQPWIEKGDGGMTPQRKIRCIRVQNAKTGERLLVNSEGYDYPRYTALEE
jgi:hypothetical protein